jgi:hypothetical protein
MKMKRLAVKALAAIICFILSIFAYDLLTTNLERFEASRLQSAIFHGALAGVLYIASEKIMRFMLRIFGLDRDWARSRHVWNRID